MINIENYMLFFEHLYDYPGNINNLLELLGKYLSLIAPDIKLAKMNIEINLPPIFCDRFPYKFNDTIFDTKKECDAVPVSTDFSTDHDGLITITAFAEKDANWSREQVKEIIFLNEQIMVLITRSRLQSQIKKAEETDNITKVLNLAGIMHVGELLSIKKVLTKFSVLALNINNFTTFNEKYGHMNGDLILKEYATVLSDFIGKDGIIGRIAADSFIVIVATSKVKNIVQFLTCLNINVEMEDMNTEKIQVSSRIGICDGQHASYFPQLIVNAKMALKYVNADNGKIFHHYSPKD